MSEEFYSFVVAMTDSDTAPYIEQCGAGNQAQPHSSQGTAKQQATQTTAPSQPRQETLRQQTPQATTL